MKRFGIVLCDSISVRSWTTACTVILKLILLSSPAHVFAQPLNTNPITVGDQAFGMAGAFTALASDATAGWYNPGGLSLLERTYISASGNVYTFQELEVENYFEVRDENSDLFSTENLSENQILAIPSTLAFSKVLRSGQTSVVGSFGIYVPRMSETESSLDLRAPWIDEEQGISFREDLVARDEYETRTFYAGPSLSIGQKGKWGLGTSIFLIYAQERIASVTDISTVAPDIDILFLSTTDILKSETTFWGLRPTFGTKYILGKWHFGLNVMFPTIRFSEETTTTHVASSGGLIPTATHISEYEEEDTSDFGRGWSFALGIAVEIREKFKLAADFTFYDPEQEIDIAEKGVFNVRLGGEYKVSSAWAVRAGLFTDLSGQKDIEEPPETGGPTHNIDIYGGTLQLAYSENIPNTQVCRGLSLGFRYTQGSGDAVGFLDRPDEFDVRYARKDANFREVAVMVGGTLSY